MHRECTSPRSSGTWTLHCLAATRRFDNISGSNQAGQPNEFVPDDILASIKRNGVCLKGTLFTPLDKSTSTQSLNVQV